MVNLIYRETHSYMHIYTDIYNFAQFTDLLFRHVRYSASNGNMMENYVSSLCNYFLNVCQSEFVSQSVYLSFHLLSIFSVYIIIIYIYIYTLHFVYSLYCTMNSWWETVISSLCPWGGSSVFCWDIHYRSKVWVRG